jgi:hypothetical protein
MKKNEIFLQANLLELAKQCAHELNERCAQVREALALRQGHDLLTSPERRKTVVEVSLENY